MRITPGRVAWYVTGRFYLDEENQLRDLGYFLHLEGVKAPLFNGDATGESSARLTFCAAPFKARPAIINGNISIGLDVRGDFSVYLNLAGGGDFQNPDSFSQGKRIATFRRVSVEMGQTLSSPIQGGFSIATNIFSADLVESIPFEIEGEACDFRDLLPNGFTQWGTLNGTPLDAFPPYKQISAFTATAIAVG